MRKTGAEQAAIFSKDTAAPHRCCQRWLPVCLRSWKSRPDMPGDAGDDEQRGTYVPQLMGGGALVLDDDLETPAQLIRRA